MKLKLGSKLVGGFLVVLVLMGVVGYFGVSTIKHTSEEFNLLAESDYVTDSSLANLQYQIAQQSAALRGYLLTGDQKFIDDYNQHEQVAADTKVQLEKLLDHQEEKDYLAKVNELSKQYDELSHEIIEMYKTGQVLDLKAHIGELTSLDEEITITADKWMAGIDKEVDDTLAAINQEADTSLTLTYTVIIAAILISMTIAVLITVGITKPVNQMVAMLKDMAESGGDLTKRVNVSVKDEIGDLAGWFNAFLDNLHDIMAQVKQSSETVSAAANETSVGNQDLSQRTEEQASSLEEISSTIEEISASLQKSSENSGEADQISRTTLESVRSSEKVVGEMQHAMADITKGSHEIAEIIAKVNDIAFQTNLLALNAAVEAARAGEQGRGFAVVAAEVRNLAGRTAESAKEIENLIKDSIVRVDKGNELMDGVSNVLGEIVNNTEQTSEVIMEIAASMKEQSAAAEDIRVAVEQLNQVTQQNASLVEEIAGSSEAVSNEAEELAALVGKFRLKEKAVSENAKASHFPAQGGVKSNSFKPQIKQFAPAHKMVAAASEHSFNEDDFEKF